MFKKKKISFIPLDSCDVKRILREYCELLKSHSDDHFKFIINSCNNNLLSQHYLTTFSHVEFDYPICQFFTHIIKEIKYSGLYFGIIASSYLYRILELMQQNQPLCTKIEVISSLSRVKSSVLCFLDQHKEKTDLGANYLISVVKEHLCVFSSNHAFTTQVGITVVKALLLAIDDSQRLGHIILKAVEGRDYCEVHNGILYKLESFWTPNSQNVSHNAMYILLFTEALQLNSDSEMNFISKIITTQIKIIACQKSINKKLIFLLRRHNIYALERLGEESASALCHLSGAFPISDYNQINWNDITSLSGIVSRLRYVSISDERYLLMEKDASNIVTIFISHRTFDTLDQLKVAIKESIYTVYSIFKSPYLLPQDCDTSLAKQMKSIENRDVVFKQMLYMFAESLEETISPSVQLGINATPNSNDIYLLKRNSLEQVFSSIENLLQVGLFACK